jgi:hypothetical protein
MPPVCLIVQLKLAPVPPGLTPELKEPSLACSTMVIAPVADGAVMKPARYSVVYGGGRSVDVICPDNSNVCSFAPVELEHASPAQAASTAGPCSSE